MRQILAVIADQKLSKLLKKSFKDKFQIEMIEKISAADTISFLEILSNFELIICEDIINKDFTSQKIYQYVSNNKENLMLVPKLLVLSDSEQTKPNKDVIRKAASLEFILDYSAFLLGIRADRPVEVIEAPVETESESKESDNGKTTVFQLPKKELLGEITTKAIKVETEKYFELDVRLLNFKTDFKINFDLYTRVKKGDLFEYNLKVTSGTIFNQSEFEKIYNRGIKQLWLKEKDYALGSHQIVVHFSKILLDPKLSYEERFFYNGQCYDLLLKFIKENKIDQNFVEIIKNILPSYDHVVKNPDTFKFLKSNFLEDKYSYGLIHSTFSCILMLRIYPKFEWSKDLTLNKLNYLSFFHDLAMGSSRLIKQHHDFQFYKDKMTPEELGIVEKHADTIAKIIEKIVKAPKEIMALMREHHGVLNGVGMSDSLNPRIYPLSKLFIITEAIVTLILDYREDHKDEEMKIEVIKEILEKISPQFDKSGYVEILNEYKKSVDQIFT